MSGFSSIINFSITSPFQLKEITLEENQKFIELKHLKGRGYPCVFVEEELNFQKDF